MNPKTRTASYVLYVDATGRSAVQVCTLAFCTTLTVMTHASNNTVLLVYLGSTILPHTALLELATGTIGLNRSGCVTIPSLEDVIKCPISGVACAGTLVSLTGPPSARTLYHCTWNKRGQGIRLFGVVTYSGGKRYQH